MKSTADSVAFPPQPKKPRDAGLGEAAFETVNEIARTVKAKIAMGRDDLKQRSKDSANVMKMPTSHQTVKGVCTIMGLTTFIIDSELFPQD